MHYVQFYQKSATTPHRLVPACGDRAVVILDGREAPYSKSAFARSECLCRGYLAYQLFKGATLTRAAAYSPVVVLA